MRSALAAALLLFATSAFAEGAGGLTWTAPAGWTAEPARPMRVATYKIPAVKGDPEAAELVIYWFGEGQGGNVDDNKKRWEGQFEAPKPSAVKTQKVGGLPATTIEIEGTFAAAPMGPMGASAEKVKKPGWKLVGVMVDGGHGLVFFKLTGPKKTVDKAGPTLQKLLASIKPGA